MKWVHMKRSDKEWNKSSREVVAIFWKTNSCHPWSKRNKLDNGHEETWNLIETKRNWDNLCQTTYWGHHGVIWGLLSEWIGALKTWGGSHFSSFYPFYGVAFPTLKRVWPFLLKLFATTMTGVKASLQVIESFMKVLRLLLNSDVNDTTTCPRIKLHFRHKMGQKWKWRKIECLPCIVS